MAWRELESRIKWDEPKVLEGVYESRKVHEEEGKEPNFIYTLTIEDGPVTFFGTRGLNDQFEGIAPGTKVRITYKGPKPGGKFKLFSVAVWEDET